MIEHPSDSVIESVASSAPNVAAVEAAAVPQIALDDEPRPLAGSFIARDRCVWL